VLAGYIIKVHHLDVLEFLRIELIPTTSLGKISLFVCNLRLNLVLNTAVLITCGSMTRVRYNTLNFVCGDQTFILISWYLLLSYIIGMYICVF
jgi:hypothetical protein